MTLNPFKESDLIDLQNEIKETLLIYLEPISDLIKAKTDSFFKTVKERVTIMIVPHNEKKIINFHIPVYGIGIFGAAFLLGLSLSSIAIVDHSYTSKDMLNMEHHGINSRYQIKEYKEEINKLYDKFQMFKPELSSLYSLIFQDNSDSLWAKGGVTSIDNLDMEIDIASPSIEELNMKELEQELKITNAVLGKIRKSLKGKKIIENTPSIWPVQGYVFYRDGINIPTNFFNSEHQKGIEIVAYPGTKIRATAPGRVESVTWSKFLGLSVSIQHKYGFSSVFSHCQDVTVKVNQKVTKGQTIGHVGKTGFAKKYMCFYQMKIGNEFIDPYPYIK